MPKQAARGPGHGDGCGRRGKASGPARPAAGWAREPRKRGQRKNWRRPTRRHNRSSRRRPPKICLMPALEEAEQHERKIVSIIRAGVRDVLLWRLCAPSTPAVGRRWASGQAHGDHQQGPPAVRSRRLRSARQGRPRLETRRQHDRGARPAPPRKACKKYGSKTPGPMRRRTSILRRPGSHNRPDDRTLLARPSTAALDDQRGGRVAQMQAKFRSARQPPTQEPDQQHFSRADMGRRG